MECRVIAREEAEEFLTLLCTVFHLDKDRASSIFYAEPFYDMSRKWALYVGGEMRSILTTTPLRFGFGTAVGIAGVATGEAWRGQGYAQRLLETALEAEGAPALLFAHDTVVYHRVGFEVIDTVVRGPVRAESKVSETDALSHVEVQRRYMQWAGEDKNRLLRDEQRWKHWQWVYRSCEPVGSEGYVCYEPMLCREAVLWEPSDVWPVLEGTEWLGLKSVSDALGVPLLGSRDELLVMGRGFEEVPQMFMTDQF